MGDQSWRADELARHHSHPLHQRARTVASIVWNRWTFESRIVIPTLLILLVYGFGVFRRRALLDTLQIWRHASFAAGMATVYLSLRVAVGRSG